MKQKLINILMIIEPIVTFVLCFFVLYGDLFYIRIFDFILSVTYYGIYLRILKTTIIIIMIVAFVRFLKNKTNNFKIRYVIYTTFTVVTLLMFLFTDYILIGRIAHDTSIGVIAKQIGGSKYEYYSIYENYDLEYICKRERVIIEYIPEEKIIDNDGIIEYNFYDGNKTITYKYEFKIELTYEEKLEYVNVFVNEVYNYDEKNLLE